MKKILGLLAVLFLVGASYAQSNNVYIGGSYTHNGDLPKTVKGAIGVLQSGTNIGGVDAGFSSKIAGPLGLALDLGYSHNGTQNQFLVMAGPELSARFKQSRLFVHGMLGAAYETQKIKGLTLTQLADSSKVADVGIGGEKFFDKVVGFRTTADYIYTDAFHGSENNVRASAGLVFRFGK